MDVGDNMLLRLYRCMCTETKPRVHFDFSLKNNSYRRNHSTISLKHFKKNKFRTVWTQKNAALSVYMIFHEQKKQLKMLSKITMTHHNHYHNVNLKIIWQETYL